MKGGQTPIHIMRWAPADYENDPFVMLMKKRGAFRVLTFYTSFLFRSHMEGGSLPADIHLLAACLSLDNRTATIGLATCKQHAKIQQEGDRLYHKRVRAGVAKELAYREEQSENGKRGGRPKKATLSSIDNPPSPLPASAPTPAPAPIAVAPLPPSEPKAETWNQAACRTVTDRYGGTAPGGRITKALRPLVAKHGEQAVLTAWGRYIEETEAEYLSPERFATTFAHWSGQARSPTTAKMREAEARSRASRLGGLKGDGSVMVGGMGPLATVLPGAGQAGDGRGNSEPDISQVPRLPERSAMEPRGR